MAEVIFMSDDVCGELSMEDIDTEIAAYETMRAELELHHMGEWIDA